MLIYIVFKFIKSLYSTLYLNPHLSLNLPVTIYLMLIINPYNVSLLILVSKAFSLVNSSGIDHRGNII